MRRHLSITLPPLLTVALIAGAWIWATAGDRVADYVLPSPGAVATALGVNWADRLASATWLTLTETVLGILLGVVVAVVVTVAAGYLPVLGRAFTPLLVASQAIPTIVLGPILTIALGYGMLPKVLVVALVCFFPVAMNMLAGINAVDDRLVNTMRSMHGTRHSVFWRLRFPSALPSGFAGLRVSVTYAPVAAVFSEYTGSTDGVGYLLLQAIPRLQTDFVFALVVVLTVMSASLLLTATVLQRICCPWVPSPKGSR